MVCFVPSGPTSLLCITDVGGLHEDSDELVFQWHNPTHIQHRAAALSSLTLSVSSCRLPANAHSELTLLPVGTHRGRNPGTTAMRYVWDGSRVTAMDESLLTQMTTASGRVTQWASGLLDRLQRAFLPDSKEVTPDYWEWLRWRLTQRFFSSTMQNLSTQSLLLALGMGAKRSIAAGAAINWLLKDGVGRVARMAVATNFGQSFDSDLKRIRFKTSLIFEATIGCEFITPFFPQHFLLLASVANVGKAIALAAFVATAPAFQQSLCNGGNLADLTAKNQAQHMVVDMLALAVSAGAMWWAKNLKTPALLPLLAFPLLASGDLYSIYRELKSVQLCTLNRERAEIIAAAWLSERRVPLAAEVSQQERLLFPSSNGHALPLRIQPLSQLLPSPEVLGPLLQQYADSKYLLLVKTPHTCSPNHHTSAPPLPHPSLNTPPAHQPNRRSSQRQTGSASHSGQPLLADSGQGQQGAGQPALLPPLAAPQLGGWLRGTRQPEPHIAVSLREDAEGPEVLAAVLEAAYCRQAIEAAESPPLSHSNLPSTYSSCLSPHPLPPVAPASTPLDTASLSQPRCGWLGRRRKCHPADQGLCITSDCSQQAPPQHPLPSASHAAGPQGAGCVGCGAVWSSVNSCFRPTTAWGESKAGSVTQQALDSQTVAAIVAKAHKRAVQDAPAFAQQVKAAGWKITPFLLSKSEKEGFVLLP